MGNIRVIKKKDKTYYRFNCDFCNKKVKCPTFGVAFVGCCCLKKFCTKHILPEHHNCTYDYIGNQKEHLKEIMPVIVSDKVPNRI